MDSHAALEKVVDHLKATPPRAKEALAELEGVLKQSTVDPRANLYQAIALSLTGETKKAATHAKLAADVAQNIAKEATELLSRLTR
jgi:hypothetical protein